MSSPRLVRWKGRALTDVEGDDAAEDTLEAADSLLVSDGRAFAPHLHRERFKSAVRRAGLPRDTVDSDDVDAFWAAAFALIPASGNWFPRVELRTGRNDPHLSFRHRPAPELTKAVTLRTHPGPDPRTKPSVKGPDLEALLQARSQARRHGADDAVIVTADGSIIDGAANAIVWWRGDTLCAPPAESEDREFARVPSVTARSLLGLAAAMGLDTRGERATPADLDGCEVWALNALHGIRMVAAWHSGPQLAEKPGRIGAWRERRQALRTPIGDLTP